MYIGSREFGNRWRYGIRKDPEFAKDDADFGPLPLSNWFHGVNEANLMEAFHKAGKLIDESMPRTDLMRLPERMSNKEQEDQTKLPAAGTIATSHYFRHQAI